MLTHTLPLAQFEDAVQLVRDREGLKIQVDPSVTSHAAESTG
jgi:hypothetical protein